MRMKTPSRPWGRKMKISTNSTMTPSGPGLLVSARVTPAVNPPAVNPLP